MIYLKKILLNSEASTRERESKRLCRFVKFLFSFFLFTTFFFTVHSSVYAATYYVDSAITDTYPASATPDFTTYNPTTFETTGGSSSVYKTIADVNLKSFSAGDNIYFRKNQTWREQLAPTSSGSSDHPITFGAYGSGDLPKIKGSTKMTNASFTQTDDPNSVNRYHISLDLTNKGFTDQTIFAGWYEDDVPLVAAFNKVGADPTSPSDVQYPGQYFYDSVNKVIYLISYDQINSNPATNGHVYEYVDRNYGIRILSKSYITITQLHLQYAQAAGIDFENANYNYIQNCVITDNNDGILNQNTSHDNKIQNCDIVKNYRAGVDNNVNANPAITVEDSIIVSNAWGSYYGLTSVAGTSNYDHSIIWGNGGLRIGSWSGTPPRQLYDMVGFTALSSDNFFEDPKLINSGYDGVSRFNFSTDDSGDTQIAYTSTVADALNPAGALFTWFTNTDGNFDFTALWNQIVSLHNAGNEIGAHTSNHESLGPDTTGTLDHQYAFSILYTGSGQAATMTLNKSSPGDCSGQNYATLTTTVTGAAADNLNLQLWNGCGSSTSLVGNMSQLQGAIVGTGKYTFTRISGGAYSIPNYADNVVGQDIKTAEYSVPIDMDLFYDIAVGPANNAYGHRKTLYDHIGVYPDTIAYPSSDWGVSSPAKLKERNFIAARGRVPVMFTSLAYKKFSFLYTLSRYAVTSWQANDPATNSTNQITYENRMKVFMFNSKFIPMMFSMLSHSTTQADATHLGYLANAIRAMPDVKWDTFSNSMTDILSTQGVSVSSDGFQIIFNKAPTYDFHLEATSPAIGTASDGTDIGAYEYIPLAVTINQASGQVDPTANSIVNFTVVFSESVSDFATGDVTLSGTAGATTAIVTGSGTTYNVAVTGMTESGTVIASLAAGVATGATGNTNTVSTSIDNTVTYDATAPTNTQFTMGTKGFERDKRCHWKKPGDPTWIVLSSSEENGVKGLLVTWTQYGADKVDIAIDDGTDNFPWKVSGTLNDGHEFLANVASWQKIKIRPINDCKTGDYGKAISLSDYPNGWYNIK